jgi:hypothetical protein
VTYSDSDLCKVVWEHCPFTVSDAGDEDLQIRIVRYYGSVFALEFMQWAHAEQIPGFANFSLAFVELQHMHSSSKERSLECLDLVQGVKVFFALATTVL